MALVLFRELRWEETKLHWGGARPPERCSLTKLYPRGIPPLPTLRVQYAVWYCLEDSEGWQRLLRGAGQPREASKSREKLREPDWRSRGQQAVCI